MTLDDITFEILAVNNTIFERGNWDIYNHLGYNYRNDVWAVGRVLYM